MSNTSTKPGLRSSKSQTVLEFGWLSSCVVTSPHRGREREVSPWHRVLTSGRTYTALSVFMAFDAILFAIPNQFVADGLDKVEFPVRHRWIFPPIKAASAVGLLAARRFPALGRLTTAMLTLYFALAAASHVRARDVSVSMGATGAFAALFATMTALGPPSATPISDNGNRSRRKRAHDDQQGTCACAGFRRWSVATPIPRCP